MVYVLIYVVAIIFLFYMYFKLGKELKTYYKENKSVWLIYFSYFFSVLISPQDYFKKEHLKEGYRIFLLQHLMILLIVVVIILIMLEIGHNPFR